MSTWTVGENQQFVEKLRRAAEILRDLGGEDMYDLADACEEAAIQFTPQNKPA